MEHSAGIVVSDPFYLLSPARINGTNNYFLPTVATSVSDKITSLYVWMYGTSVSRVRALILLFDVVIIIFIAERVRERRAESKMTYTSSNSSTVFWKIRIFLSDIPFCSKYRN